MVKSNNVPEVITKSARSIAAKKMWERRRLMEKNINLIKEPNWFQKHIDTIGIVAAIAMGVWIMKTDIHGLSKEISKVQLELSKEIADVRLEVSRTNSEIDKIKTILIVKELVPKEAFVSHQEKI